jgi:hypothetical protein
MGVWGNGELRREKRIGVNKGLIYEGIKIGAKGESDALV